MADAIGLGASLLGIAAFGASVVTTLRTFAASYASADKQINSLSADVALTTSILTSLGTAVRECEAEFGLRVDNFLPAREACERCFETLRKALREARAGGKGNRGDGIDEKMWRMKGRESKREVGAWDKLMFALGGEENMKSLVTSLETAKSNLQLLLDSMNLLVLKNLNKKHLLKDDQAEDLRLLVQHIPTLLNSLQHASLIGWVPTRPPPKGATGIPTISLSEKQVVEMPEPDIDQTNTQLANLTTTAAQNPPQGKIDDVNDNFEHFKEPGGVSDDGVDDPRNPSYRRIEDRLRQNEVSDGTQDIYPGNPHRRGHVPNPRLLHDTTSLYEGWLLVDRASENEPTLVKFCGLKMEIYTSRRRGASYIVKPFSRDREKLKRQIENFELENWGRETTAHVSEILGGLHRDAQSKIRSLLKTRNNRATKPFGWKFAAVVEISKEKGSSWAWRKDKKMSAREAEWLIILKGGLLDSDVDEEDLPDMNSDPWKKAGAQLRSDQGSGQRPPLLMGPGISRISRFAQGSGPSELSSVSSRDAMGFADDAGSFRSLPLQNDIQYHSRVMRTVEDSRTEEAGVNDEEVDEEFIPQEDAERQMDEFLATFLADSGGPMRGEPVKSSSPKIRPTD